jgi:hypothetical protein
VLARVAVEDDFAGASIERAACGMPATVLCYVVHGRRTTCRAERHAARKKQAAEKHAAEGYGVFGWRAFGSV